MPAALKSTVNGMVAVTDTYSPAVPPVEVPDGHVAPFVETVTPVEVAQPQYSLGAGLTEMPLAAAEVAAVVILVASKPCARAYSAPALAA